jgi:predicted permease
MKAPRLARLWVRLVAPPDLRQAILDDLDELLRAGDRGRPFAPAGAWLRYWREALRGTPHLLRMRGLSPPGPGLRLEWLWRDSRHGLRGLRREPTFTVTAILTLALGVATTTTVFSVADAQLWKPLPFPDSERLVTVNARGASRRAEGLSGADLLDWRAGAPAFSDLAGESHTTRRVLQLETAESVLVTLVTANYFTTLGRPAIAGRTFTGGDARDPRLAMLTDRTWRRLFNADPAIAGKTVVLDSESFTVTGVVAAVDVIGGDPDVFVSIDESDPAFLDRRQTAFFTAVGRLRPGVGPGIARDQLQAVVARLPADVRTGQQRTIAIDDLASMVAGHSRPIYFFLGASLIVLALGAVNVATLLLSRAVRRSREFALRGALGGGRAALVRQLLVEGALLALPGAAAALLIAQWSVGLFASQLPADFFTRGTTIPIDLRVAAFALAVTGLTTAAFVLAPVMTTRRLDLSRVLGTGSRAAGSFREGRLRRGLLATQIALTVVLLAGAGIFLKSFAALTRIPLGFDPVNAIAVATSVSGPRYGSADAITAHAKRMVEAARAVPGVREAGVGTSSPLGSGPIVRFVPGERARRSPGDELDALIRAVDADYFRALGMRITRGRPFAPEDVGRAPRVAIVDESVARESFADENPIGRVIELLPGARAAWTDRPGALVIVGVVATVKDVGLNEIAFGNIYVPFAQLPAARLELVVRAAASPEDILEPVRKAVANIDPAIPVTGAATFDRRVTRALQGDRFNLLLISTFAGVALLLAAIGVYGTVAYYVDSRTRDLGLRLALGARRSRLVGTALWQTGRVAMLGCSLGLAAVLLIAAVLGDALYLVPGSHNGLLYGVSTTDPLMLGAAVAGTMAVAIGAGAIPARRVTRLDPVRALAAD